ncbi:MAG: SDR family oxidoreductase, partial [Planctomycetes bacterium]|nr:SDR family oxidoreductase [Planctomycetota bacterium]
MARDLLLGDGTLQRDCILRPHPLFGAQRTQARGGERAHLAAQDAGVVDGRDDAVDEDAERSRRILRRQRRRHRHRRTDEPRDCAHDPMMRGAPGLGNGASDRAGTLRGGRFAFQPMAEFPSAMGPRTGTCLVVGASSGIGLALARRLALSGRKVAMLARRERELAAQAATTNDVLGRQAAFAFAHDAADLDAVESLFARIEQDLGPVDEVHFVAGVMPDVAIDEFDLGKDRLQVQVNMLGCIAWGNAAARRFLARKSGCFVGVSSVAGDRGRVGRPVYNASKAGMDCYLEALRNRLWRHGVQVTTIRPGFV